MLEYVWWWENAPEYEKWKNCRIMPRRSFDGRFAVEETDKADHNRNQIKIEYLWEPTYVWVFSLYIIPTEIQIRRCGLLSYSWFDFFFVDSFWMFVFSLTV